MVVFFQILGANLQCPFGPSLTLNVSTSKRKMAGNSLELAFLFRVHHTVSLAPTTVLIDWAVKNLLVLGDGPNHTQIYLSNKCVLAVMQ